MAGNDGSAPAPEVPSKPVIDDDQGKLPPGTGSTTGDTSAKSSNGEALRKEIVRQVEFYFGDANLPTDDFMLKHIKRSAEGWVPIRVLADFHKMKKLSRSFPTIVAALRTSTELEVSPEGKRIRRLAPLPEVDLDDVRSRTIITWNLPEKPTIEQVIELFSKAGHVVMARIRKPEHAEPLLTKGLRTEIAKGARDCYALIEYSTAEEAAKAVAQLHDESDWRRGLRVKPLLAGTGLRRPATSRGGSPVKKGAAADGKTEAKGGKGPEGGNHSRARGGGGGGGHKSGEGGASHDGGALYSTPGEGVSNSSGSSAPLLPPPGLPAPSSGRRRSFTGGEDAGARHKGAWEQQPRKNKSEYAAWASAGAAAASANASTGAGTSTAEGLEGLTGKNGARPVGAEAKKGVRESLPGGVAAQPRMPDGSKGFGMGRGDIPVSSGLAGLSLAPGAARETP